MLVIGSMRIRHIVLSLHILSTNTSRVQLKTDTRLRASRTYEKAPVDVKKQPRLSKADDPTGVVSAVSDAVAL